MGTEEREPAERVIVVGLDGSEGSLYALEWAARQAELTGSTLQMIAAWEWPTLYGLSQPESDPEGQDPGRLTAVALGEVAAQVRRAHREIAVYTRVIEGDPAAVLIEASRRAELLVVGSRGHGEFVGMLLGSVGQYCVAHAHCPVLVVRGRRG